MRKRDYNLYDFASIFELNNESPSGLVWKVPRLYFKLLNYNRVGKPAGTVREFNKRQKYWVVTVFGKTFFCHRIVFLLANGISSKENDIDHIDGNSLNNKLENLREVLPILNCRNSRVRKGKDLPAGLYYEELFSKTGTLLKRINVHYSDGNGKVIKRNFSVLKYGYDEAVLKAKEWRNIKILELNEQGFGYTNRHGK
jgi:hypothetical protein